MSRLNGTGGRVARRLRLLLALCLLALTPSMSRAETATLTVTDLAGRAVTVRQPVGRLILGEGRLTYLLALLDREDPFRRVVGWRDDLRINDHDSFEEYAARFPTIRSIPVLGNPATAAFSVEAAIALKPDLLVLTMDSLRAMRESGALDRLDAAGIPTVFVDFRFDPFRNTVPTVRLLGRLLGRDARAEAFDSFFKQQIARVDDRLAGYTGPRPTVFLERAPGLRDDCCLTFGHGNLGLLIDRAGGRNIADGLFPGDMGGISLEKLIVANPDVVIATGANWALQSAGNKAVPLGYGADPSVARERLRGLTRRDGFADLRAVRQGRVHAIWHQFYSSPYLFIALQAFAKWLHPTLFADLDPDATFRDLHERFLPVPYRPGFWVSLKR